MSNYAGPSSHYPDDLPSDSEPGKIYDGMQDHSRVRSYGSKFDNYLASKPMRTELDIINDQDFQDRDKETIVTWLSRRINQIDNEIKLEKRIRGKTTIT